MTTFEEILKLKSSDIKPPKVLPTGEYEAMVIGQPQYGEIAGTTTLEFTLALTGPYNDETRENLKEFGQLNNRTIRYPFFEGDDTGFYLSKFMDNCGVPKDDLDRRIAKATNRTVGVSIKHSTSKNQNDDRVYPRVAGTFALNKR